MRIFITIIGETKEPLKWNFKGNYAIETMFIRISEYYFGKETSVKIEGILKTGEIRIPMSKERFY